MFDFFKRKADLSEVTPEDIQRRQAAGERLFLLDVREPAEYAEAHIAGKQADPTEPAGGAASPTCRRISRSWRSVARAIAAAWRNRRSSAPALRRC